MKADAWGILDGYVDALEERRFTSPAAKAGILRAMGVDADSLPPTHDPVRLLKPGERATLGPGQLHLEDGGQQAIVDRLPPDLPLGYHDWIGRDGRRVRLIVSPGCCVLPEKKQTWGWAVQLYAARSRDSWGIGDLVDLRLLGDWAAEQGADLLLINPLNAVAPLTPQEPSPYYPSSRRFRNPLYLRLNEVPGYAAIASELQLTEQAARELNDLQIIDRDSVFRLKMSALRQLWKGFHDHAALDGYCRQEGAALDQFAAYCVLAEAFGKNWRQWETQYQRADSPAVARFVEEHSGEYKFHQWLQWLIDEQLAAATARTPVMLDLPVGVDPDGADAWAWQDVLANDARIGAPPDVFNTQGQDWGLPPFVPHKLRAAGYRPFIETIRAALRHAGGLRIDHALGLFRLYWIPAGAGARGGGFVRYAADELLAIIALESQRAGAVIVAEDLGTVEPSMRDQLAAHNLLSYRLLWFEKNSPADYAPKALAAVTTHDLPTVAGLWTGSDLEEQRALNLAPSEKDMRLMLEHLANTAGIEPDSTPQQAVLKAYEALATAPCAILAATLEDALAIEQRPNIPNTTGDVRPNWSLALPEPIEELAHAPLATAIAARLSRATRKAAAWAEPTAKVLANDES